MSTIPTPEEAKPIPDFATKTFDGDSLLFQSRNGEAGKIDGDQVADYVVVNRSYTQLGNKTIPTKFSDLETAISNIPTPMTFKGTLGTGGTITTLPAASSANEGWTYKVIEDGTYAGQAAQEGDVFVSNGSDWVLIPSANEALSELSDVTIASVSDGDIIYYDATTQKWKNRKHKILSAKLTAGATSITISDASITADCMILPYFQPEVYYNSLTPSDGSVTLTFDEQSVDINIKLEVK